MKCAIFTANYQFYLHGWRLELFCNVLLINILQCRWVTTKVPCIIQKIPTLLFEKHCKIVYTMWQSDTWFQRMTYIENMKSYLAACSPLLSVVPIPMMILYSNVCLHLTSYKKFSIQLSTHISLWSAGFVGVFFFFFGFVLF